MDLYSSTDVTYFIEKGKYFEWSTIIYEVGLDKADTLGTYTIGISCVDDLFYMRGFSRCDKNGNWVADYSFNTEYSSTDTYGYETKGFETYFKMKFIPSSDVVLRPYGMSANDMNYPITYICDGSESGVYGYSLLPAYRDYLKGEKYATNVELVYTNGTGEYSVGDGIDNYAPAGFTSGSTFTIYDVEYNYGELLNPLQVGEVHFKWVHRTCDTYTQKENESAEGYYLVTRCKYCKYEISKYYRYGYEEAECDHNWEYTYNETSHWQRCTKCQDTQNKGSHDYTCEFNKDKNKCIMTCSVCGRTKACDCEDCNCGTTHTHNYTNWKDNGDGTHTGTCKCGDTKTEKHNISYSQYSAVADKDKNVHYYTCKYCDYVDYNNPENCTMSYPQEIYKYECGAKRMEQVCEHCPRVMKTYTDTTNVLYETHRYYFKASPYYESTAVGTVCTSHQIMCISCGYIDPLNPEGEKHQWETDSSGAYTKNIVTKDSSDPDKYCYREEWWHKCTICGYEEISDVYEPKHDIHVVGHHTQISIEDDDVEHRYHYRYKKCTRKNCRAVEKTKEKEELVSISNECRRIGPDGLYYYCWGPKSGFLAQGNEWKTGWGEHW